MKFMCATRPESRPRPIFGPRVLWSSSRLCLNNDLNQQRLSAKMFGSYFSQQGRSFFRGSWLFVQRHNLPDCSHCRRPRKRSGASKYQVFPPRTNVGTAVVIERVHPRHEDTSIQSGINTELPTRPPPISPFLERVDFREHSRDLAI